MNDKNKRMSECAKSVTGHLSGVLWYFPQVIFPRDKNGVKSEYPIITLFVKLEEALPRWPLVSACVYVAKLPELQKKVKDVLVEDFDPEHADMPVWEYLARHSRPGRRILFDESFHLENEWEPIPKQFPIQNWKYYVAHIHEFPVYWKPVHKGDKDENF